MAWLKVEFYELERMRNGSIEGIYSGEVRDIERFIVEGEEKIPRPRP